MAGDGEAGQAGASGPFGRLIALLLAEKAGFEPKDVSPEEAREMERFARDLMEKAETEPPEKQEKQGDGGGAEPRSAVE